MKKNFLIAFFIVLHTVLIYSQGFDWELSPRLPFAIPKTYFGITTNFAKNFYNGSLSLFENYYTCSVFSTGDGNSNSVGFKAEYWFHPAIAFNCSILLLKSSSNFSALGDSFRVLIKDIPKVVQVANELFLEHNLLVIDLGAKHRISTSNIYFAGNLEFALKLSSKYNLYEQVLSPPEYHFIDNSQRRKILNGSFSDYAFFLVTPKITIGYDAIIFPKIYASPCISIYIPLFNLSKTDNLKMLAIQLGFSIMYGMY